MDPKKSTAVISLLLVGGAFSPLFLTREHRDCYATKTDCDTDWGSDCTDIKTLPDTNAGTPNCNYLGRSRHSYYGGGTNHYSSRSTGTISRGGFGSHGFSSGHS